MFRVCRHCLLGECSVQKRDNTVPIYNEQKNTVTLELQLSPLKTFDGEVQIIHFDSTIVPMDPKTAKFLNSHFEKKQEDKTQRRERNTQLQVQHQSQPNFVQPQVQYQPQPNFVQPQVQYQPNFVQPVQYQNQQYVYTNAHPIIPQNNRPLTTIFPRNSFTIKNN